MRADVSGGRPAPGVAPQQREDEVEDDQSAWAREEQQVRLSSWLFYSSLSSTILNR